MTKRIRYQHPICEFERREPRLFRHGWEKVVTPVVDYALRRRDVDGRRVTIATGLGLLTGCYCAASLFIPALKPPGLTSEPEVWWLAMLVMGRTSQGFVVGLADRINIHPVLRGAVIGAAMTLQLAMMPLFGPFKLGAALLMVAGIIYGIIEDVIATWATKRYSSKRQGAA